MTDKEKLEKIEEFIKNKSKELNRITNSIKSEGAQSILDCLKEYIYSLDHPVLKECPFCGGRAKLNEYDRHGLPSVYSVSCSECHAVTLNSMSQEEAVNNWNKRSEK